MLLIFLSEKYNVIFGIFPPTEKRVCIVKKFVFKSIMEFISLMFRIKRVTKRYNIEDIKCVYMLNVHGKCVCVWFKPKMYSINITEVMRWLLFSFLVTIQVSKLTLSDKETYR